MIKHLLATLLASAGVLAAADRPSAEAVFDKYIDATGGLASYEKVESMSMRGTVEIAAQSITAPITIVVARPDRMGTSIDIDGVGIFRSGTGQGMAWEANPMQGPRLLEGEERDQRLRSARIDKFVKWKQTYSDVKVEGEDTVDGKACWRLVATPAKETKLEKLWFDKQTGLLLRASATIVSPMGEVPAETFFSDYRDVGGRKVAFKLTQTVGPQTLSTTLAEVKFNPDLPATQFDPPAEVQALIKK